jgi:hypothetical protein
MPDRGVLTMEMPFMRAYTLVRGAALYCCLLILLPVGIAADWVCCRLACNDGDAVHEGINAGVL